LGVALHNAPFDLAVLDLVAPGARVYDWVEEDRVCDTQLLHRLHALAVNGTTASQAGESTLERCASTHLGVALPKDVKDSRGNDVRLAYGQWLNRPPNEIGDAYLDYLAKDCVATFWLHRHLLAGLDSVLNAAAETWGYVSAGWLRAQVGRWGYQTHHIQVKAAVGLRAVTANGLTLDADAQGQLSGLLTAELTRLGEALRRVGYLPGEKGSGKALQAILRRLAATTPGATFPRTPTGQFATSKDALAEIVNPPPFLKDLAEYNAVRALHSCFVGKLRLAVIRPNFQVLVRTGRTASYGELNAQNLPRDDRVRGCFVPSPGHVFIKADYATVEMSTLAQAVVAQFW
jgi:hypothetical protein